MKKESKIKALTIALIIFGIILISGIVLTSSHVNKELQKDRLAKDLMGYALIPVKFTLKIYASDGTSYRGRCSFDGTNHDWTSWGNKTFEGNSWYCFYYFTKWDPGYVEIEIYINNILTHSQKISSSTSSPIKMAFIEFNPPLKIIVFSELFGSTPFKNLIVSIFLIVGGIVGIVFSIILYRGISFISTHTQIYPKYPYVQYKRYTPTPEYRLKTRAALRCPACKAPLRKNPPCECEYCGTMIV